MKLATHIQDSIEVEVAFYDLQNQIHRPQGADRVLAPMKRAIDFNVGRRRSSPGKARCHLDTR
jgi:hypothetical protein